MKPVTIRVRCSEITQYAYGGCISAFEQDTSGKDTIRIAADHGMRIRLSCSDPNQFKLDGYYDLAISDYVPKPKKGR